MAPNAKETKGKFETGHFWIKAAFRVLDIEKMVRLLLLCSHLVPHNQYEFANTEWKHLRKSTGLGYQKCHYMASTFINTENFKVILHNHFKSTFLFKLYLSLFWSTSWSLHLTPKSSWNSLETSWNQRNPNKPSKEPPLQHPLVFPSLPTGPPEQLKASTATSSTTYFRMDSTAASVKGANISSAGQRFEESGFY